MTPIQPLLQTVLHPTHMNNPSWPQVVRRLKKYTVREFSDCGQCLLVKIGEQHFLVRDGAHDIYSYDMLDDNEVEEYTNTPLDQLVEEFTATPVLDSFKKTVKTHIANQNKLKPVSSFTPKKVKPKKSERKTVMLILDTKKDAFHFCGTKLQDNDLWFFAGAPLFECVERIMVLNKVAHNVTYIERIRSCGTSEDFEITYNTSIDV